MITKTNPASFTRPADTTAYASGDLVANSTTAGSVVPVEVKVSRRNNQAVELRRMHMRKSGTGVTNASFRVHVFENDPRLSSGITSGDNAALAVKAGASIGSFDVTIDEVFSDGAEGAGAARGSTPIVARPVGTSVWLVTEARGAYTPASAEVFTFDIGVDRPREESY